MAIEINKTPKMKNTPKGPVAQPAGTAEPKIETPASDDDLQAAAQAFLTQGTAKPAEEEATAAPKEEVPTGFKKLNFLTEQSKTAKGLDKERIEGAIAKITGESGQHFDDMDKGIQNIRAAYGSIKSKMGGLVTKDSQEKDVDLVGDVHLHINNLIDQAARHITAASAKDEPGTRLGGVRSAASILAGKTGTRVRPSDVATGGYDTLEKYSPVDSSQRGPTEAESIEFLNNYTKSSFLKQAEDFESMGAADHVEHARNLLAGVTQAAPQILKQIGTNPKLQIQSKNSGQSLPSPADAKTAMVPALLSFSTHAQKYIDFANSNPGLSTNGGDFSPKNGVMDRFGLNHHLTRLKNLAESVYTQRSHEQRFNIIKNAYQKKYGALLAKRSPVTITTAAPGNTFKGGKEIAASTSVPSLDRAKTDEAGNLAYSREKFYTEYSGASRETVDKLYNASFSGLPETEELERQAQREHLSTRADSLSKLAGDHPLAPKWNSLISSISRINPSGASFVVGTSGVNSSIDETARGHAILDKVETSMQKNGVVPLATRIVKKSRLGTDIPSPSEFARLANMGSPVRQSESYLQTGEHEEDVDPTMGGLKGADEPMVMGNAFGYTGNPAGSRVASEVITSPSASGFNVPSDKRLKEFMENKRQSRRASRRATLQASIASATPRTDTSYRYDPFFTGSVAPMGGTNKNLGGIENEVSNQHIKDQQDKYVADDGLLRPAVDISRDSQKEEDIASDESEVGESKPVKAPRKTSKKTSTVAAQLSGDDAQDQKAREAERAAAIFDITRGGRGRRR